MAIRRPMPSQKAMVNPSLAQHEVSKLRLPPKRRTVGLGISASQRVRNQITGNGLRRGK